MSLSEAIKKTNSKWKDMEKNMRMKCDEITKPDYYNYGTKVKFANITKHRKQALSRSFDGHDSDLQNRIKNLTNEFDKNNDLNKYFCLPPIDRRRSETNAYTNFSNLNLSVPKLKKYYEPTYITDPREQIDSIEVQCDIERYLSSFLNKTNVTRVMKSHTSAKFVTENLTSHIKENVKRHIKKRFKVIVNCSVIEQQRQGCTIASKCLWDQENDFCVSVKEKRENYVFIVNFYAVYHE